MKRIYVAVIFIFITSFNMFAQTTYYVAKNGKDSNNGSLSAPFLTISKALSKVSAGDKILIREGRYKEYLNFTKDGTKSKPITLTAYPGEHPIIDGSGKKTRDIDVWGNEGILLRVSSDYAVIKGLELQNAASFLCYVRGNHVTYEDMHVHNSYLAGVYFYKCSYGIAKNNVIHDIYDYDVNSGTGGGGNADGIGASSGNRDIRVYFGYHLIENNIIYNTSDDIIDVWSSRHNTLKYNKGYHSGYSNYSNGGSKRIGTEVGDGNGYKLGKGGYNLVYKNVSFDIRSDGFDSNSGDSLTVYNNTTYNCKGNGFQFYDYYLIIKNNLEYKAGRYPPLHEPVEEKNSWNVNANITDSYFESLDPWSVDFLHLSSQSENLIDNGVDVGLPYNGSAPDIGAYETLTEKPAYPSSKTTLIDRWMTIPSMAVTIDNDKVYFGNGGYLEIVDISDPKTLSKSGEVLLRNVLRDIAVKGNYAYVALGHEGLRIIDVSKPSSPTEVGFVPTNSWVYGVAVSDNYAYIAEGEKGLRIIDISNPLSASEVGVFNTDGIAHGVAVNGNYAYVADLWNGLRIIDISNPSSPSEVGFVNMDSYVHNVEVIDNYAYVAAGEKGLIVVDVRTPSSPKKTGAFDTEGYARDVAVSGKYAYVADWDKGLSVIDITTPSTPVIAGYFDTEKKAHAVAVNNGYAYLSDGNDGMYVIYNDSITGVEGYGNFSVKNYSLEQNFPNPFNPTTEIKFTIPVSGNTTLEVYNVLGQKVKTLLNKEVPSGSYTYQFDAGNLTSGIYFYKLSSGNYTAIKKMILIK